MTVLLLADPRAQTLSFSEREVLFKKVSGFDGVRFMAGNGEATLVRLRTYRGHSLACGSRYRSPDALYVVDQQGAIYDIGTEGALVQTWWLDDRWIALWRRNLDASWPTRWAIWHVEQANGTWQQSAKLEITTTSYSPVAALPLRFEAGYQVMIASVGHVWTDDPCEFTTEFNDTYRHSNWQMQQTYRLVSNTYELVSSEVLTFTVQRKDTDEQVVINWQDYCAGPIR